MKKNKIYAMAKIHTKKQHSIVAPLAADSSIAYAEQLHGKELIL